MSTNEPPDRPSGQPSGQSSNQPSGQSPYPQQPYPTQGYPGQPSQPGPQGYPPQPGGAPPGYYQPPPPKKKHTLRNILLVLLGLSVLIVGGCIALIAGAVNEADKAVEKSQSQDAQPGGPDNPLTIHPGKPFEVSDFKYQPGWTVGKDSFGDVTINKLRVTNDRDKKDSALVEIKFWKGSEVLALSDCTTSPIAPGTTVTLTCSSADRLPKKYDKITINDTF